MEHGALGSLLSRPDAVAVRRTTSGGGRAGKGRSYRSGRVAATGVEGSQLQGWEAHREPTSEQKGISESSRGNQHQWQNNPPAPSALIALDAARNGLALHPSLCVMQQLGPTLCCNAGSLVVQLSKFKSHCAPCSSENTLQNQQ
jgi:hypothetical protein